MPLDAVIEFKREVYRQALTELYRYLGADRQPRPRRMEANVGQAVPRASDS